MSQCASPSCIAPPGDDGSESCEEVFCRFCLGEKVPSSIQLHMPRLRPHGWMRRSSMSTDALMHNPITSAWNIIRSRRSARPWTTSDTTGQGQDVMLVPCSCKGSQKHVHASCLQYWIATKMAKGYTFHQATRCPVCKEQYTILPPALARTMEGGCKSLPVKVVSALVHWYFSSCFMVGAFRGIGATAQTACHLALSPLWLFPGLPLHAVVQTMERRGEAPRTITLAFLGMPILPVYTKLALQSAAFVVLKGWVVGGLFGSFLGGRQLLRWSSRVFRNG